MARKEMEGRENMEEEFVDMGMHEEKQMKREDIKEKDMISKDRRRKKQDDVVEGELKS
jgi:hypothetical protein